MGFLALPWLGCGGSDEPEPAVDHQTDSSRPTFAELRAVNERVNDDRELVRQGELRLPGVKSFRYDIELKPAERKLIVTFADPSATTRRTFLERYGPLVEVVKGPLAKPAG